jgi:hypothetical protein
VQITSFKTWLHFTFAKKLFCFNVHNSRVQYFYATGSKRQGKTLFQSNVVHVSSDRRRDEQSDGRLCQPQHRQDIFERLVKLKNRIFRSLSRP